MYVFLLLSISYMIYVPYIIFASVSKILMLRLLLVSSVSLFFNQIGLQKDVNPFF